MDTLGTLYVAFRKYAKHSTFLPIVFSISNWKRALRFAVDNFAASQLVSHLFRRMPLARPLSIDIPAIIN